MTVGILISLAVLLLFPASGRSYPVTIEAEDMPIKMTGSAIPGGWNISSKGYIATSYEFAESGSYSIDVVASGTLARRGWPKMKLLIDQVKAGVRRVATTKFYASYLFIVNNISAGEHEVAVAFTNDYNNPPVDRNLFVDKVIIAYNPPQLTSAPAPVSTPRPPRKRCEGVSVFPSTNLAALVKSSSPGTRYCIKAGEHNLSDGITPHTGDSFVGEPGAILDGEVNDVTQAFVGFCVPNAHNFQDNVTIRGLVIKNFKGDPSDPNRNAAINPGCNWRIENNEISHNREVGVKVNRGTVLLRNNIHHNGRYGVTATPSVNADILIQENEIAYNNTRNLDPNDDAGGSKLVGASVGLTGVRWIRNWVHHNTGNGIWHDIAVGPEVEIAYNTVEHNTGAGIFVEISTGHEVHDNLVRFNAGDSAGEDCFFGSQIHNNNSSNVNVYRNYVESVDGSNGICLVDALRNDPPPSSTAVTNCKVYNNTIKVQGTGASGLVGDRAPYDLNDAHFEHNTYYVPSFSGSWAFGDYPLSMQQWQAIGQDMFGNFLTW